MTIVQAVIATVPGAILLLLLVAYLPGRRVADIRNEDSNRLWDRRDCSPCELRLAPHRGDPGGGRRRTAHLNNGRPRRATPVSGRGGCREAHDPWPGSPCISAGLPHRRPGWRSTSRPHTRAVCPPPFQICQICSAGASLIRRSRTALYRDTRRSPAPGAGRRQPPPRPDNDSIPGQGHGRHLDRPETLARVASVHRAAARRNDQALPEQTVHRRANSTATNTLAEWLEACRTGRRADRRTTIALEPDDVKGPKGWFAGACSPVPFSEMEPAEVQRRERPKEALRNALVPSGEFYGDCSWWNSVLADDRTGSPLFPQRHRECFPGNPQPDRTEPPTRKPIRNRSPQTIRAFQSRFRQRQPHQAAPPKGA